MAILNKKYNEEIENILYTQTIIKDNSIDINIVCTNKFNPYTQDIYTVAKIYDTYTMTYVNGVEKEYKKRKCALNSVLKVYNSVDKYNDILNFKPVENVEEIQEIKQIESKKQEVETVEKKEYFIVGNICFNTYEDAKKYCLESDFIPEIMIRCVNNGTPKTKDIHKKKNTINILDKSKKIKVNRLKINLLDKKIDRILDKTDILKGIIDSKGIKYNDKENKYIIELNKLNNEMDNMDNRIDVLLKENRVMNNELFSIKVDTIKKQYNNNKYKVINTLDNSILYTNNIEKYLYNTNYTIFVLIKNQEIKKQYTENGSLQLLTFAKNDTVYITEKKENYYNNKLCYKEIQKEKNSIKISSINNDFFNINNISIFKRNKSDKEINLILRAMDVFKNDIEVKELFDKYYNYIHKTGGKTVLSNEEKNNNYKEYLIKKYSHIIDKFPKLKKVMKNIEYYNNIYRGNLKGFFKEHKTNGKHFSNYQLIFNTLEKLLKGAYDNNLIDNSYLQYVNDNLNVVYTTKYRK